MASFSSCSEICAQLISPGTWLKEQSALFQALGWPPWERFRETIESACCKNMQKVRLVIPSSPISIVPRLSGSHALFRSSFVTEQNSPPVWRYNCVLVFAPGRHLVSVSWMNEVFFLYSADYFKVRWVLPSLFHFCYLVLSSNCPSQVCHQGEIAVRDISHLSGGENQGVLGQGHSDLEKQT